MKQRVLAILAAGCLIALAVVARNALAGDDGGGGGKGKKGAGDDGPPVVACTPDLMPICDALADDGTIAKDPPKLDLDEAAAASPTIDGWITWSPTPEMANFDAVDPSRWSQTEAVMASPFAASATKRGGEALSKAGCRLDPLDLGCLAQEAIAGRISVGVGSGSSAEGLARIAPLGVPLAEQDDFRAADAKAIADFRRRGFAAEQSVDQVTPGLGPDVVLGPRDLLLRTVESDRGTQQRLRLLDIDAETPPMTVVISSTPQRDLSDVTKMVRGPGFKSVRTKLFLTAVDKEFTVDPGELYQVWQAVKRG